MLEQFRGGIILAGGIRKALGSSCHVGFRCLKIGRHRCEDFRRQAWYPRKRRTSLRKCSVRGERQVSTGPLGNIVVIHKTFLPKQALETVPLPNYSVKWRINICRLISQDQPYKQAGIKWYWESAWQGSLSLSSFSL